MRLKSLDIASKSGVLFEQLMPTNRGKHWVAFIGVYLFTLVLWARPHELYPPLAALKLGKVIMIGAVVAYLVSKVHYDDKTIWPLEAWMIVAICILALVTMPVAVSSVHSEEVLQGLYIKILIMFVLLNNLIDMRKRLYVFLKLLVFLTTAYALDAIWKYLKGEFSFRGRIEGVVDGMFGNPNSLAMALDLMLPVAIVFAFITKKRTSRLYYLACSVALVGGVLVSLSRGGFLALAVILLVLLWKLSRKRRLVTFVVVGLMLIPMPWVAPSKLRNRVLSIIYLERDDSGSTVDRIALLKQGISMIPDYWILGVGMNNYHLYTANKQTAHNTYIEILIELGILGLIAYLVIIIAPLLALWRVQRQTENAPRGPTRDIYYLSVGLQASFAGYCISSFFGSVEYYWFLYYIAAFAIALKRIHGAEQAESATTEVQPIAVAEPEKLPEGILLNPLAGSLLHRQRAGSPTEKKGLFAQPSALPHGQATGTLMRRK